MEGMTAEIAIVDAGVSSSLPAARVVVVAPRRDTRGVTEFCFLARRSPGQEAESLTFLQGAAVVGESFSSAARRELVDVTGCRADPESDVILGAIAGGGLVEQDVRVVMYTVTDRPPGDAGAVRWLSAAGVDQAIGMGDIDAAFTLSAWAKVRAGGYDRMRC